MAENASAVTPTVKSIEAEIARTRERLSVTLTGLNGDVRALLDPEMPVLIAPAGHRDAVEKVAVGLRSAGQISALVRPRKAGGFGILRAVAGLIVWLFRSGAPQRLWSRRALNRTTVS